MAVGYEVAGIGSRLLAGIIDTLVVAALMIVLGIAALLLAFAVGLGTAALIVWLTGAFLISWGYFVLYETVWHGQTPGKRALELRVLKVSGAPIGFMEALVRNIVRPIDALPGAYGVAFICMLISRHSRRLGDYAAGTIVVKEGRAIGLNDLRTPPLAPGGPSAPRGALNPEELVWRLEAVDPRMAGLIDEFVHRVSFLPAESRRRIGANLARVVAERVGATPPSDPEAFLLRIRALHGSEGDS